MTLNELSAKILAILPDAVFDEQDGEVVISTGMALSNNEELLPIEEAVFGSGFNDE